MEIDPAQHFSRLGRNARDAIGMPHVGVNLPPPVDLHIFELVDVPDRLAVVLYRDAANLLERCGIEESQRGRAIAENERLSVLGKSPALPGIGEGAQKAKAEAIVDQRYVRFPRELHKGAAPGGESLPEVLAVDRLLLEYSAGLEIEHAQGRLAVDPGALVNMPIDENQALG